MADPFPRFAEAGVALAVPPRPSADTGAGVPVAGRLPLAVIPPSLVARAAVAFADPPLP